MSLFQSKSILYISGFMGHKGEEGFLVHSKSFKNVNHFQLQNPNPVEEQNRLTQEVENLKPDIIYAYSMGGRLLLSLLAQGQFENIPVVLESVGVGGMNEEQCQQRVALDIDRGKKLAQDFKSFIKTWYKLPLWYFDEGEYQQMLQLKVQGTVPAETLGKIIAEYSPGKFFIESCRSLIQKRKATLYLAGEKDEKYKKIATELGTCAVIAPDCGHNIHFQNPNWVLNEIREKLV